MAALLNETAVNNNSVSQFHMAIQLNETAVYINKYAPAAVLPAVVWKKAVLTGRTMQKAEKLIRKNHTKASFSID